MARIRTIKPDFWSDSKMVKLSAFARLFYIGMWNFALCERGHLPDDADDLKLKILPADPVDGAALLAELVALGRVERRAVDDGRTFLLAKKLPDHQKTDPRWKPRCPYCALESSEVLPEPQQDSPELADTPPDSPELPLVREGKGREGNTAPTVLPALPASASVTQRSKRITDAYAEVQPMSRWPAINGVVIKAIKAGRYTDDEIRAALLRLAADGRSVTVETLRVEIEGIPPRASPGTVAIRGDPRPSTSDQRFADALAAGARVQAMLEGKPS